MTRSDRARPIRTATVVMEVAFWGAAGALVLGWWGAISWTPAAVMTGVLFATAIAAAVWKGMLLAIDKVEASHRAASGLATAPPSVFYRVNTLHVPLANLRRLSGGRAGFAKGALLKLLRIRLPHLYMPDPAAIELVSTVSPGSRTSIMLEESVRACRDAGLIEQFAFRVPQLTQIETLAVLFATPDRRVLTVANATISTVGEQTSAAVSLLCWSRLDEERRITTSTFAGLAPSAPWDEREVMRGRSVADMMARHLERIEGRQILPFSPEKAGIMHEFLRMNRKGTDYLIARGILEPMTPEDVNAVRQRLQTTT